jgi:hypothetical protein
VRRVLLLVGLVIAALPAAPALADTTVGQTGGNDVCGFPPPGPPPGFVAADTNYAVPAGGGTITSFSFQSTAANSNQTIDFLALHPTGGSNYTVVGKTGQVTLAGSGSEPETFPASIPVQAGDILGFWIDDLLPDCTRSVAGGGAVGSGRGDPNTGDTVTLDISGFGHDLNESANLAPPPVVNPPASTSPTSTSPAPTSGCQDPTGAYNQGFNGGFNSGFDSGFHAGFNSGFHAGLQPGFHAGFGSSSRHGTVSAATAIRAHAIPAECNPQFNQGFNTAFNVGFNWFNSGFQRGFNSGFTSGFKHGFRARHHRARNHHHG